MTSPLVSILIPAYNAEPWLAETLSSATEQTYPNVEVVVVDDGSTDRTLVVAQSFEGRGVRVVSQQNQGQSAAYNRALAEARGDLIQHLDADDLLSPDKIERQVDLLAASPPGCLAVCGTVYFEDGSDPKEGRFSAGRPALNSDNPVQWLVDLWTQKMGWGLVSVHAWLVPRTVAERAGPWDTAVSQDVDGEYFARVLLASSGVRWDPHGRAYYRKSRDARSQSRGRSERHLRGRLQAVDSKKRHVMPRVTNACRAQAAAGLAHQYLDVAFHAYPACPAVAREAEAKAAALGGADRAFFSGTRLKHVEKWTGWKTAKRLSHAYHQLRARTTS